MATSIQVEKPKEVWLEIRKLIENHYSGPHQGPFMKEYPELYHLYLRISAHKTEFKLEKEVEP